VGEHEGQHYFSMGFVEGNSLSAKVADGPLPPNEAAELVRAVAEADFFDGRWIPEKFHTLHYLTGNKYGLMTQMVEARREK